MPIATYATAYDTIMGVFKTGWDTLTPTVPPVFYDDVKNDPPATGPWARASLDFNNNRRVTVGGSIGNRRFTRYGILTIQIFTPVGDGRDAADTYAQKITDIFEGMDTGADAIFFRDCDRHDLGVHGSWWQTNMIIRFEYDTVK